MMCFHYPSRDQRSSLSGCWSHSYCVLSQPRETQIQPVRECWRWIWRQLRCTLYIPAWGWSRSHWSGETGDWDLSSVSRYPPTSDFKDITYWEFISPIFVRFKVYSNHNAMRPAMPWRRCPWWHSECLPPHLAWTLSAPWQGWERSERTERTSSRDCAGDHNIVLRERMR